MNIQQSRKAGCEAIRWGCLACSIDLGVGRSGRRRGNFLKRARSAIRQDCLCQLHYTGKGLHWELVSQKRQREVEGGRSTYEAAFALLPTVNHLDTSAISFRVCSWRTKDAKNDLPHEPFLELCERALRMLATR